MPMLQKLAELRAVAERLALGDAESRKLRGLVVDLIDVMLGREPDHPDVNGSGARYALPDPAALGVMPPAMAPRPFIHVPPGRPVAPLSLEGVPDPAGPDALAQIERELNEAEDQQQQKPPNGGH